ncbi:MAG TPA: PKD domain-containing protein [Steroidobacter sp.]|uniref:PKD domain-containing protein n=1 Tax=Steroidobacter sp. TaxID=1978227 RepID=UPI002ED92562
MTDRRGRVSGRSLVATVFLATMLAACGGGGGSGGDNTNPPAGGGGGTPPPTTNPPGGGGGTTNPPGGTGGNTPLPDQITYSGVTTPATLDAQNSPVIAGALLYELGLAYGDRPSSTAQVTKPRAVAKLSTAVAKASKGGRRMMQAVTTESCEGGGSIEIDDRTNDSVIGTVRFTYTDCIESGVTINGVMLMTIAAYDLARDEPTDFIASFHGYTETTEDGASIDIGGSIHSVSTSQLVTITYHTVTRYRPENVEYRFENLIERRTPLTQAGGLSVSVQGRMYHSTFGYVEVSTNPFITFSSYSLTPTSGTLRLQGAQSGSIAVTFMPANQLRLSLDENGDGMAERSLDVGSLTQLGLTNHRAVANAGPDMTIVQGQTATIRGSGSDWENDPLTYEWRIVGGPLATQVIGSTAQVSFTPTLVGSYLMQLSVTDLPPYVSTDTMTLLVTPNADPVARAGADVLTSEGSTVVLDGGASTDAENDPITFNWALISAPAGSNAPTAMAGQRWNFVPDRPGTYEYRLRAADAYGQTFDNVRITAEHLIGFSFNSAINVDASTTLAAAQRSAPINVSTHFSGAPIGLSASTNVPWLNIVSAPADTSSGASLIVGIVPAQVAHLANGTHSAQVTVTPTGYTARTVTIALNLQLPHVEHVTPYVAYSGTAASVALYGSALQQTAGGTLLIDGTEVQGFTNSVENRAQITLPGLAVGEYELRVSNNLGIERPSARFVVRQAPTYPDGEFDVLGRIESVEYDTERDAFYIVSWDLNYGHHFDAYRIRYDGTQWQRDPIPVPTPLAASLNVDGTRLYVTAEDCSVTELDPVTLAVLQTNTGPSCYYDRYEMISGFADGRMVVADTNQWHTMWNYPAFTNVSPMFPSVHNPIHLLNDTREKLLWAESPTISDPQELYIYDVATRSFQEVGIRDPDTYFLPYYLGISGDGRRFMHGADVYEDGVYIGSLQGVGPYHLNAMPTYDGTRAVAFDYSDNRLGVFDLTSGPNFPRLGDLAAIPETIGMANILRLLPDDSAAVLFSVRTVSQDNYVFRAYVRNLP